MLSRFIPAKQLRKILALIKLEKGEPIEDINKHFTTEEAFELKNSRRI